VALVERINLVQQELEAAQFERQRVRSVKALGRAEVEATLDSLGDVGRGRSEPTRRSWKSCTGALRHERADGWTTVRHRRRAQDLEGSC
jgi:hypothetical protein